MSDLPGIATPRAQTPRPRWATPLALGCALTLAFTAWRDLQLPHVRDTEVWFGFELHGALARATAPLHWAIFAAAAWGFARLRPWIWPWASVYAFYVALSHLIWSEASPQGQGWPMGLLQAALLSIPGWLLLRARPPARASALERPPAHAGAPEARRSRMMSVVRWSLRGALALLALTGLVFFAARFHDGPLGMLPGGPLVAGELVSEPVADWTFARDVPEIELQLESQRRSRSVWILVHEGRAFVPCSLQFPPGKSWHRAAAQDGRATLRIAGRRHPVTLRKLDDGDTALALALREEAARKYPNLPPGDPSAVWVFAVESRAAVAP